MSQTIIQTLEVDVPEVEVQTVSVRVVCGATYFDVHEYNRTGSGQWAVWLGGAVIDDQRNLTYEEAVALATQTARSRETKQLLHKAVNDATAATVAAGAEVIE